MIQVSRFTLLAVAALLVETTVLHAQVSIRVPFVNVEVGNGVRVQAPFVNVRVPPRNVIPVQSVEVQASRGPVVIVPPGPPSAPPLPGLIPASPIPGPVVLPAPRALTLGEFASQFRPAPGNYEVLLVHPCSGKPVKVCFSLPPGNPCKVHVDKHRLEFDYGNQEVSIRFLLCNRVRVSYN